ncbi:hypothetical protein NQ314_019693 [Rhamnusium bicolor]|uniref:Protein transport protein sec16 n=1 Tax=Rhamnusium bicolor TaxID=1586634 RepID=A0AAV8WMX5_9CUCU|nr:hypothetical protein NQ314_019693 [Rhamnusium bicolor]
MLKAKQVEMLNQWQNHQSHDNWYSQPQQQYQAVPKQEPQPPAQQSYWPQPYTTPQTASYNQNVPQQHYGHQYPNETGYYQNNTGYEQQPYGNMHYNQQYNQNNLYSNPQQTGQQKEGDSWNWGWGDEDNSNVQVSAQQPLVNNVDQGGNNLGDAFVSDKTWNWGVEDAKANVNPVQNLPKKEETVESQEDLFPKMENISKLPMKTLNEPEFVKPLPSQDLLKVTGKRGKLDTPQWSTESQMSQESSDDILHTSESDKRQEPLSSQNLDDVPLKNETSYEDLASNHQFENKEILSNSKPELPSKVNPTPPPPKNTHTPPLLPPPGAAEDLKNPYKRSTGLSHKSANKFRASNSTPPDSRQNLYSFHNQQVNLETLPDNSEQPDPVPNQPVQKLKPVSQWPDNNEAPINDRNQYLETGQLSGVNLHDYNREGDLSIKQEANDTLPPPGLRRMVPGQMEQNENLGNVGSFGDEPPPGLSRMVLGQTETVSNPQMNFLPIDEDVRLQYEPTGPPEGLHRMVPGESSSPESTLRHQQQRRDENDSESEFDQLSQLTPQPRSATIGADTPPAVPNSVITQSTLGANRSETIGGGDSTVTSQDGGRSKVTSTSSNENKGDKNRKGKVDKENIDQNNRRDSIEGQTQEHNISNLTNSVRNLTVGGTVGRKVVTAIRSLKKLPRSSRDKRSLEKSKRDKDRERENYRYSPDNYKDKKYDRRRYKERRYEEDTDYYSDKEKERRMRDDRDRDYERKYSSLRKDKDKDRRRRDPRDYGRDRRADYYYSNRYDDEYENENRSRPSSRSDSMHESYRERHEKDHRDRRHRDRERERYRRQRDPREMFNPYQGVAYDPYNPYYQQYQYYENLRRTNPQAYAEWYRKYYQQASYGGEDRASVHSGRSSANDELAKDRYTRQSFYSQASIPHMGGYYGDTHTHSISGHYGLDNSSFTRPFDQADSSLNLGDDSLAAQRVTPAKFATAHIKASIASGKLLRILPHYPMDGQNAIVEVCNLQSLLINDEDYKELNRFPGPLVRGVTHKKTIIEYCENKIRHATYSQDIVDVDSYVLMWELLILLIRQNGMVVGTDIAELLLKNKTEAPARPSSVISSISSVTGEVNPTSEVNNHPVSENTSSTQSVLKEEEVTNKFREFLLYGSGIEALEWAMKHGLWGHALFLASKLDKRTYANVMMRFANGLTLNDPLQTLYQLLSGKMPAAVTCVSDEKWGDWRPHLAMILSNTQRPELNCKAITTLGDTLNNRGSLYAAQFCYLMAEVGFGKCDNTETRLVLLGSDHSKPFPLFASNEAIHMTEIYEYACGLNDADFIIPEFQIYKYLLATRLADRGLLEKALSYLEKVSAYIVNNATAVQPSFVDKVCSLADRLKFYDPVGEVEDESEFGGILETSRPDNSWLKDLRAVQNDYQAGLITHESINNLTSYTASTLETDIVQPAYEASGQESWQQQYDQQYQQNMVQQQPWQPEQQQPTQIEYQQQENLQQSEYPGMQYQDQQNYWSNQQPQWGEQLNSYHQENVDQQQSYYGSNAQVEPKEVQKESPEVSTCRTNLSPFSLPMNSSSSLRKRLTAAHSPARSNSSLLHGDFIELQKLKDDSDSDKKNSFNKNHKIYPYKNRSAEDFIYSKQDSLDKKSSSRESSDLEIETYIGRRRQKNVSYKNEEKSQLICYKDNTKVITIKNDSKHTRYNTFDMRYNDKKGKLVKYKSLDIPDASRTVVKYLEPNSKVSISAEDFDSDYKVTKFERKKHRHDIITDTVDAWAKKSNRNVFSNIKNSLFKSGSNPEKEVVYKPLIFGGTYPIDCPMFETKSTRPEPLKISQDKLNHSQSSILSQSPKIREYGPPRTFDIDQPI